MAQKYSIIYNDIANIEHECQIFDDAYSDDVIDVLGKVFLDHAKTDDPLEAIRGKGLRVELEADQDLTFSDLYTEEEKTLAVIYIRNSVTLFSGWLNPEGWFEDFVTDRWKVGFDCVDGLGYLDNLSFVEDDTGLQILGKKTMLECISLALIRTGLEQNINIDIQIFYTGLSTSLDILDNANVVADRYIKDDGETIFSCEEVLRDILEPFGACIVSKEAEWYIYKPNQIHASQTITYFRYDFEGTPLSPTSATLQTDFLLGSNVNNFLPHHCSENQRISVKNSIGAYRINYKYGQAKSLIDNSKLITEDDITIDDWTILDDTDMTFPVTNSAGIALACVDLFAGVAVIETDDIALTEGNVIEFNTTAQHSRFPVGLEDKYIYQITLDDSIDIYYLNQAMEWIANDNSVFLKYVSSQVISFIITNKADPLPVSGDLQYTIWNPERLDAGSGGLFNVLEVAITNSTEGTQIVVGEFHTFQRTTKPSSKVEREKEVATGDNEAENFVGAIYKADQTTTTSTWNRGGVVETLPILGIMGEETLRMSQQPARVFSGNVFGFFPYLSRVQIDGLTGIFMPVGYSYDTYNNVISCEFREIFSAELDDIDYVVTLDYGKTVKPTIIS